MNRYLFLVTNGFNKLKAFLLTICGLFVMLLLGGCGSSAEDMCTEITDAHLSAVLHRDFDKIEKLDKQGVKLMVNFSNIISPQEEKRSKPGYIHLDGAAVPESVIQELTAKKMAAQKKITWKISTENLGDIRNDAGNHDGKDKYLVRVRWNTIDKQAFDKLLLELRNKYNRMSDDTKDEKYGTVRNKVFCEGLAELLDNPPMKEEEVGAILNENSENSFEILTGFYSVKNRFEYTSIDCGTWWYQNQDLCYIQLR